MSLSLKTHGRCLFYLCYLSVIKYNDPNLSQNHFHLPLAIGQPLMSNPVLDELIIYYIKLHICHVICLYIKILAVEVHTESESMYTCPSLNTTAQNASNDESGLYKE